MAFPTEYSQNFPPFVLEWFWVLRIPCFALRRPLYPQPLASLRVGTLAVPIKAQDGQVHPVPTMSRLLDKWMPSPFLLLVAVTPPSIEVLPPEIPHSPHHPSLLKATHLIFSNPPPPLVCFDVSARFPPSPLLILCFSVLCLLPIGVFPPPLIFEITRVAPEDRSRFFNWF